MSTDDSRAASPSSPERSGTSGRSGSTRSRGAGATVVGLDLRAGDGVLAGRRHRPRLAGARPWPRSGRRRCSSTTPGSTSPPGGDEGDFATTLEVNVTGVYNATQVFGGGDVRGGRRLDRQHRLAVRVDRADPGALRPHRAAVHEARRVRRVEGGGRQPDPLLRAPVGAVRRARERALARRRPRRPGRGVRAQVLRPRPARPHGRAGRPRRRRCSSSPRTPRAT